MKGGVLEGIGKMRAKLGQRERKSLIVIAVAALFMFNLSGALAAGSASVGDYVWDDQDGDGKQGGGFDVGINGVVVELYQDGVWQENSTTRDNPDTGDPGWYLFENLDAGNYVVKVADSNFESGGMLYNYALTTDNNPLTMFLEEGETYSEADFGYEALASPADPGDNDEPTAVILSSFAVSSASGGVSHWPWLAVWATLAAGGMLWIRRQRSQDRS
jgi:hypothetical protein